MSQHESNKGCKENEIFFLDDNHMFLISSEKIVHDITGHDYKISNPVKFLYFDTILILLLRETLVLMTYIGWQINPN